MSNRKLLLRFIGGVVLVTALMGCASPTPTPTLAPTVDIQPTLNAVKTQSAATVIADLTKNAPTATKTAVPTIPTNTPRPTATVKATNTLLPWWTKTPTQPSGSCTITESSPLPTEAIAPNGSFDGKWVIKNVGDGKWLTNETDIRYASGTKFQTKADVIDLKNDVAEEESYTVIVDMKAPATAGTYVTTWVVNLGGQVICSMPLTIKVQ
jgi:hypothetical protein